MAYDGSGYGMLGAGRMMEAFGDNPEAYDAIQSDRTKQLIAQMLLSQGMQQPQGQMVGRFYVPPSPLQHISGMAQAMGGLGLMTMADRKRAEMAKAIQGRQEREIQDFQQQIAPDQVPVVDRQGMQPTSQTFPTTMPPTPRAHAPNVQQMPIEATRAEMPDTFDIDQLQGGPQVGMAEIPKSKAEIERAIFEAQTRQNPRLQHAVEFFAKQRQTEEQKALDREQRERDRTSREEMNKLLLGQKGDALKAQLDNLTMRLEDRALDRADRERLEREKQEKELEFKKWQTEFTAKTQKDIAAMRGNPKAEREQNEKEAGYQQVQGLLAELRSYHSTLKEGGGQVSTEAGPMDNLGAYISGSSPGQFVGKVLGTKNQEARNKISMTRPILMTSIMKAAGMSAKQLDSNAELKLWLTAATDPDMGYEANMQAMKNIENYIDKTRSEGTSKRAESSGLSVGDVEDGYIYLGGDPANPKSWEKKQ